MTLPELRSHVDDEERRRALRSMKLFAGGLLVVAAIVYVIARRWENSGDAPEVVGYVRAAAEAGMIGGLADWFAVTALFRRPLGLPIPHTAIIPTRKDQIGESLGEFVGSNFLSADAVRERLRSADVTRRVGRWLATESNAERVSAELATLTHAGIDLLRDDDVQPIIEQLIERRLQDLHLGPTLGKTLAQIVQDRAHRGAVDLVARSAHEWLATNEDRIAELVSARAPRWSPRFVDRGVASLAYGELLRLAKDVDEDPDHPVRHAIDRYLVELADDLQHDPATGAKVDEAIASMGQRAEIRAAVSDLLTAGRKTLLDIIDDPQSQLRQRLRKVLVQWGQGLVDDPSTATKIDARIEAAAVHVVTEYRGELTRLVTDTVQRWDAVETSKRIELQVGRDLQFIRVNGTVVGALVGIVIHAVSQLL